MTSVANLFARGGAANYAKFRPSYPEALVSRVLRDVAVSSPSSLAVDVGCGTGQLSVALADRGFARVIGVDVSAEQVAAGTVRPNIEYRVGSAHALPIDGEQIADAVCIAQTMHWLDPEPTFAECSRLLKHGGIVAVIGYPVCSLLNNDAANAAMQRYHFEVLRPYWHPNRWLLDDGYKFFDLADHGFDECAEVRFEDDREMSLDEFIGYASTSSARATMIESGEPDPLDDLRASIAATLGSSSEKLLVRFPFFAKLGTRK
jgi:SAM-dependent methyltransferase